MERHLRTGTVHGTKHVQMGMNNQDAVLSMPFSVPSWRQRYHLGVVSDGCSGIPAITHTEFGAHLIVTSCLAHIQQFILGGTKVADIPTALYPALTSMMRSIAHLIMPPNIYWPHPITFPGGVHEFRNRQNAWERFMTDYMAATIVGFVDDGETLVTFQVGDGVIIVNNEITIVDQNDQPDYPALSVNSPGKGFAVQTYPSREVERVAVATDGIEELLAMPQLGLPDLLFTDRPDHPVGLQWLLNRLRKAHPDKLADDCTVATMVRR